MPKPTMERTIKLAAGVLALPRKQRDIIENMLCDKRGTEGVRKSKAKPAAKEQTA